MKNIFGFFYFIFLSGFFSPACATISEEIKWSLNCTRPTAEYDVKVNNVRLTIRNAGGIKTNSYYFSNFPQNIKVPAIENIGLWIGGKDRAGNIKLSAFTDEYSGFDYSSGPLHPDFGNINYEECKKWNKIFTVNKQEISKHILNFRTAKENQLPYDCNTIPDGVKFWPGVGNPFWKEKFGWELPDQPLAFYFDADHNGFYNPCLGDYPMNPESNCRLFNLNDIINQIPAEMSFYIINDAGSYHTLTGPANIGMEVHVYTFLFSTNDEINNMSFMSYKTFHSGFEDLYETNIGINVTPGLGCPYDNYIGYDKKRRMGFIYNNQEVDGYKINQYNYEKAYPEKIPTIGIDVLQTPYTLKKIKRDEDGIIIYDDNGNPIYEDLLIGETGEILDRAEIHSFMYYADCSIGLPYPIICGPNRGNEKEFYNYLNGLWLDGTPLTKGDLGYNPGSEDQTFFAFPDNPSNKNKWSMCTANFPKVNEVRFVLSVGKIFMYPGWSGDLSIGIPSGFDDKLPCPDLSSLYFADDKAQQLFDNCFILPEVSYLNDIEDDFISSIYPNPFSLNSSNHCFVTSSSELKSAKIFDMFGNSLCKIEGLLKISSSNTDSQYTYELDTKIINILPGLYFIVLEDRNNNSVIKKWLVN
jgi:hypothetical protein